MLYDDRKGNILTSINYNITIGTGSVTIPSGSRVGSIIYTHGLGIITNPDLANMFLVSGSYEIEHSSNLPVYTTTYLCRLKDYEYNFTLNPSAVDSNGNLQSNLTGSEFTPYITSVGLYNDAQELLAVAKLSQPLSKSDKTDMVIQITLDY